MKKLDKMLFEGIKKNDLKKVVWALNLGADVNAKDDDGETPLDRAVYRGYVEIAKHLITSGATVNINSLLYEAIYWDRIDLAKHLITSGATVNINSLLYEAIYWDRIDLAKHLIASGAKVNVRNKGGSLPLDYAKSEEMKELLQGAMA